MMDADFTALVRAEVAGILPFDAAEATDLRAASDWIDSGADLCRRVRPDRPPQHLVSYFAVMDGDWVLLVDHINAGLWLPPGGHVEPGEPPRETVVREAMEEVGIEAQILRQGPQVLTITRTVGATTGHVDVSLWYVLQGWRDPSLDYDRGEFHGIRRFHRNAVPLQRSDPQLGRFLAKLAR